MTTTLAPIEVREVFATLLASSPCELTYTHTMHAGADIPAKNNKQTNKKNNTNMTTTKFTPNGFVRGVTSALLLTAGIALAIWGSNNFATVSKAQAMINAQAVSDSCPLACREEKQKKEAERNRVIREAQATLDTAKASTLAAQKAEAEAEKKLEEASK